MSAARRQRDTYDPEFDYSGLDEQKITNNASPNDICNRDMRIQERPLHKPETGPLRPCRMGGADENLGKQTNRNSTKSKITTTPPLPGNPSLREQRPRRVRARGWARGRDPSGKEQGRPQEGREKGPLTATLPQKNTLITDQGANKSMGH